MDLREYLKIFFKRNKKWILILITTVVLLEVIMSYIPGWKTLKEETVDVGSDKGVVQTASLMPKNKTTTDELLKRNLLSLIILNIFMYIFVLLYMYIYVHICNYLYLCV